MKLFTLNYRRIKYHRLINYRMDKKKFLLIFLTSCFVVAQAHQSNGVTISNFSVSDANVIGFTVSWSRDKVPSLWSDSVWVFVDYRNAQDQIVRLPLNTTASALTSSSSGYGKKLTMQGNNQGIYIVGDARSAGSFSATVQLVPAKNWQPSTGNSIRGACAYATNFPPYAKYNDDFTQITFTGSSLFKVMLNDGNREVELESGTNFMIPSGYMLTSFTDATGAPGKVSCTLPATYTLNASASDFCPGDNVTFSLSGTQTGVSYQLYRDGTAVGSVLAGTGSAATFSGYSTVQGTYMAKTIASNDYCVRAMTGSSVVMALQIPPTPTITAPDDVCEGTALVFTASGYENNAVLNWTGTGGATKDGASYTYPTSATAGAKTVTVTQTVTTYGVACTSAAAAMKTASIKSSSPGGTYSDTDFCPGPSASNGSTWTLRDTRDSKTYKLRKMEDGRIWMVQDLQYGPCKDDSFGNADNASTAASDFFGKGTYGHCRTNTVSDAGYLYNWTAAVQNKYAYYGSSSYNGCVGIDASTNKCRGLCPEGFHVPTHDEFAEANNKFLGTNDGKWNSLSQWQGVLGGFCDSFGLLNGQGSIAHYWSSTQGSSINTFDLYFHSGDVVPGESWYKNGGLSVRCVRNY
jgi:uncharacterized protein (TIGR02145 family)